MEGGLEVSLRTDRGKSSGRPPALPLSRQSPAHEPSGATRGRDVAPLGPTHREFIRIERLAQELANTSFRHDAERYVQRAQMLWHRMPRRYQQTIAHFKRFSTPHGGLHLVGLPTGPVPPTPEIAELAADRSPVAAAVLSLVAAGLGDQFGFKPELSGLVVQAILPMKGAEFSQRSISSLGELNKHVETAFTEYRADHIGLFCLRADHDGVAGTTLAPVEAMLRQLPEETIAVLRQSRFETTVDESFLIGAGLQGPLTVGNVRVVSGPQCQARLRVDFAGTTGTDADAQAALDALADAATAVAQTVSLTAGSMLLIDNHCAVHGRTEFTPRWDGEDRWLLRTFTTRDLTLSAAVRPNDGRIIDIRLRAVVK